jgi:large subunit ribosomal protein L21
MLGLVIKRFVKYGPIMQGRTTAWAQRDFQESKDIHSEVQLPQAYQKITYDWQHNLALKAKYRARREAREAQITPAPHQDPALVIHSFDRPEVTQPRPDQIYAVVKIGGLQYKVAKDDSVMVEKLPHEVGSQVVFDQVFLLGSPTFTLVGRPVVGCAKVYATVEEQTLTDKVYVFKKRRRHRYKKFAGHRQDVTMLRVDCIEHSLEGLSSRLFLPMSPEGVSTKL